MSRLELKNISKEYLGVKANDQVCLTVESGEIHAILGENGAGKSPSGAFLSVVNSSMWNEGMTASKGWICANTPTSLGRPFHPGS